MSDQRFEGGGPYSWSSKGFPAGRYNHRSEVTGTPAFAVDRKLSPATMTSFEPRFVDGGVELDQLGWMLDSLVRKIEAGEYSEIRLRRHGRDVACLQPSRAAPVGQRIGIAKDLGWGEWREDAELDAEIAADFDGEPLGSGPAR